MSTGEIERIAALTDGMSGSDLWELYRKASSMRMRRLMSVDNVTALSKHLPPISTDEWASAAQHVKHSKQVCEKNHSIDDSGDALRRLLSAMSRAPAPCGIDEVSSRESGEGKVKKMAQALEAC